MDSGETQLRGRNGSWSVWALTTLSSSELWMSGGPAVGASPTASTSRCSVVRLLHCQDGAHVCSPSSLPMHCFSRGLSIFVCLCLCPLNTRVVPYMISFLTSLSRVLAFLGELYISHGLFFSWYFYALQTFCHLLLLSLKDRNKRWGGYF